MAPAAQGEAVSHFHVRSAFRAAITDVSGKIEMIVEEKCQRGWTKACVVI